MASRSVNLRIAPSALLVGRLPGIADACEHESVLNPLCVLLNSKRAT